VVSRKQNKRSTAWTMCSCGGWTYDCRKLSHCQLCGEKLHKDAWPSVAEWPTSRSVLGRQAHPRAGAAPVRNAKGVVKGPPSAEVPGDEPECRHDDADDEASTVELEHLARAAEAMQKALGAEAPETKAVLQRLQDERKKRDVAKPLRTQILAMERKVDKKKKATAAAAKHAKDLDESIEEAKKRAAEAKQSLEAVQDELQGLEAELQALRLKALDGPVGPDHGPIASAAGWMATLPKELQESPEYEGDREALRKAEAAMRRLQALAIAAAPPPMQGGEAPAASQPLQAAASQGYPPQLPDEEMELNDEESGELDRILQEAMGQSASRGDDAGDEAAALARARATAELRSKLVARTKGIVSKKFGVLVAARKQQK